MKELFAGRHFDREIIVLCVHWYLRYKLSLRDLVEMMAERGLDIAHTTIMRWVQRYVPEFEKRWNGYARKSGRSWLRTQLRAPVSITLDGYAASHRAVREIPNEDEAWKRTPLRSSKYLNNLIEPDHRGIKSRTRPMLGFKNFDYAAITIAGVELLHRIRKGQFALHRLRLKDQTAPAIWNAVLAA
ncbi:IS6 family transposase [Tunturiibacter gelidiferens]|uniref:IS6 family transposase n=1 Tax=Tunturiibacter gelidiferens TaxID=3069689 RepID=UPI003D9B79E7